MATFFALVTVGLLMALGVQVERLAREVRALRDRAHPMLSEPSPTAPGPGDGISAASPAPDHASD